MALRNALLRLAGYDPRSLAGESRETTQPIALAGATVALAATVTGLNWGVAGFSLVSGGGTSAFASAAIAGLLGASVVTTIDRAGIFVFDTQSGGRFRKGALLAGRVALCLLVGAATTEFITPRLLNAESKAMALAQREHNQAVRVKSLREVHNIDALRSSSSDADTGVAGAEAALAVVPQNIRDMEAGARTCWRQHADRKRALLAAQNTRVGVRQQLAPLAARCTTLSNAARNELAAHQDRQRQALDHAQEQQRAARAALTGAESAAREQLSEATAIEKEAISAQSTGVIGKVLETNPDARRKWWIVYALIVLLELSPLLFKAASRQTVPGMRIATDYDLSIASHMRRREEAIHQDELKLAERDLRDGVRLAALQSPATRDRLKAFYEMHLEALTPLELAKRTAAEIEEAHDMRQSSIRRYPDCAGILNAVYDKAFDDVLDRLRNQGAPRRPFAAAA
jgi:hypothetical protein